MTWDLTKSFGQALYSCSDHLQAGYLPSSFNLNKLWSAANHIMLSVRNSINRKSYLIFGTLSNKATICRMFRYSQPLRRWREDHLRIMPLWAHKSHAKVSVWHCSPMRLGQLIYVSQFPSKNSSCSLAPIFFAESCIFLAPLACPNCPWNL